MMVHDWSGFHDVIKASEITPTSLAYILRDHGYHARDIGWALKHAFNMYMPDAVRLGIATEPPVSYQDYLTTLSKPDLAVVKNIHRIIGALITNLLTKEGL